MKTKPAAPAVFEPKPISVRIAAVQYLLRSIHDWSGFENQVRFVMKAAGDYKPQFVLLPEIFTTQLLSFMDTSDLRQAVRNMNQLRVFDTPHGRIAILICYDIEFPELSRKVCEMGADIIFVPSCTDDRQGFLRVRYCCHARAIENQVYVAVTGTVGNLPVEGLGLHYGQAAIITPSDFPFARDGIAAEGVPNMEQIVIADVDLSKLVTNRVMGTTIPLYDKRVDVYDNQVEIIPTV